MSQEEEDNQSAPEDTLRELQEELSKLCSLESHKGYEYFLSVLTAQRDTRRSHVILTPLKSMDEVLEQEYKKGECGGLELALNFVQLRKEDLRNQIAILTKEVEANVQSSKIPSDGEYAGHGERLDLSSSKLDDE
jgi:hypothetical protein